MSSKDKDNKSLQDKLKQYFRARPSAGNYLQPSVFMVTAELEREIGCETPYHKRLKTLRELGDKMLSNRLENRGVERIYTCIGDLLQREQPREYRHAALAFLRCLIQGQYEQLTIMRGMFFRFIREHDVPEDAQPRFEMLQSLTENGKDIKYFEEEIGRFLLEWMQRLECPALIRDFLELIVNLVKFNAAYLDEDIVSGIVNNCCYLCCYSGVPEVIKTCLQVLEAVVSYSIFPHAVLRTFVSALCRSVNVEHYCQISWKIMRNMLGTDLGHAALYETVEVLKGDEADAGLTRGAVFYINMALWGSKRVTTLKATHTSVLPAFLKALDGGQSVVTYEVILALQSLITRHGSELHEAAWDLVFSILTKIISQLEEVQSPNKLIESHLHDTITAVELLNEQRKYNGNVASLYALVDRCGHTRPEASVLKLIEWRAAQMTPARCDWLTRMSQLLERYCRHEKRVSVRAHTQHTVHRLLQIYRRGYEEELLERVVMPHVQQSALDADPGARLLTARLLSDLALHCHSKACSDLLDVAEKLLNRPFDLYVTSEAISLPPDTNVSDIRTVLDGLIRVFHRKLLRLPSSHAVRTYLILLGHLERHYSRPALFHHHPYVRTKILELFLSARANKSYHIGFCYDAADNALVGAAALRVKPVFSPYVCVDGGAPLPADGGGKQHSPSAPVQHQNTSFVSIRKACRLIIQCLTQEKEWTVLHMVLREIPNVMQNKPLILSKQNNDIDMLASALCSLVTDKSLNLPESLRLPPGTKLGHSDFHGHVLPVLASLAPYHLHLDPQTQQKIVKCLIKFGLVLRTPQQCISALTIYTLETRDTMVKLLPEVLLKLSQISDTSQIAVPILEFLSTLTRLPKMFASFVADQYMSVFAILLPYTNPSRYNHYVVSLAHHVIAAWFLKCRLSYRRNFVQFIIHGLHNFAKILPFEEAKFKRNEFSQNINEDSSTRMRSSSLGSKGREPMSRRALSSGASDLGWRSAASASAAFHHELTETCVDLMARYAFSPCSVRPRRGPAAEFMFAGGQSSTWLVGHKLVTITTSGCLQNSLKQGLCDRCLVLCKQHIESIPSPGFLGGNTDPAELRADGAGNAEIKRCLVLCKQHIESIPSPGFLGGNTDPAELRADGAGNAEIKRYTKYTLQHSRSVETSSSSISDNSLQPPSISSGQSTRQNSSENRSSSGEAAPSPSLAPATDAHAQLSLKLENLAKQEERGAGAPWWRGGSGGGGGGGGGGGCVCWCAGWVEVYVRRPTGDVSWVMRMQNQMNFDSMLESPLNDIIGLLAPSVQGTAPYLGQAGSALNLHVSSSHSSGLGDSRNDILSDTDPRSRSGSSSSQHKGTQCSPGAGGAGGPLAPPELPPETPASGSEGGVATERRPHVIAPPHTASDLGWTRSHVGTEPINIPGSPQRQSSSSTTTDDDDTTPFVPGEQGKSRHPVRRSNSSPEMSSSWKAVFQQRERADAHPAAAAPPATAPTPAAADPPPPSATPAHHAHLDMIVLPGVEPTSVAVAHHHQKKTGKNKDMRVSCEAIPEEMFSSGGTPPSLQPPPPPAVVAAHPHLMTYNSDPGQQEANASAAAAVAAAARGISTVCSDTALNMLTSKASGELGRLATSQKAEWKLMAKPPQAPAPASPARLPAPPSAAERDDLPPLARSKRSNTISVMSPTRKNKKDAASSRSREAGGGSGGGGGGGGGGARAPGGGGGVTPAFVLLQLYHNMNVEHPAAAAPQPPGSTAGTSTEWVERPLMVSGDQNERSIKTLDHTPPLETYQVGVLYVGPGQADNETNILRNEFGSIRYAEFLQELGTLIALEDAEKHGLYLNVERGGKDGHFTYVWQDDIMQVHFHVATLMPNSANDPTANEKRKHIGNDYVSIVYNDSGVDFNIHTIKGQFNLCIVMIEPLEHGINRVTIKTKDERIESKFLLQTECKVISDQNLALLARQLALHCTLASLISCSMKESQHTYASNSLQRLRIIKRLRSRLIKEWHSNREENAHTVYPGDSSHMLNMDDFTDYT